MWVGLLLGGGVGWVGGEREGEGEGEFVFFLFRIL